MRHVVPFYTVWEAPPKLPPPPMEIYASVQIVTTAGILLRHIPASKVSEMNESDASLVQLAIKKINIKDKLSNWIWLYFSPIECLILKVIIMFHEIKLTIK